MHNRIIYMIVVFAGCSAVATYPPTQQGHQISPWGVSAGGLEAQFTAPTEVEQNAAVSVSFKLRCEPRSLAPGVDRVDAVVPDSHLRLVLVNAQSGKRFQIPPYDSSLGMLVAFNGERTIPLDGTPISAFAAEFPLRSAGEELQSGEYDCTLSYSSERGYRQFRNGVRPKGLWTGELQTESLRLKITPEVPKERTFLVPARLRVTRDQKVIFNARDAQRITAVVGNGMFIGTRITSERGESLEGDAVLPDAANPIDDWSLGDPLPAGKTLTYIYELFETSRRPEHLWSPGPGAEDYRTVWKKTFVISMNRPR